MKEKSNNFLLIIFVIYLFQILNIFLKNRYYILLAFLFAAFLPIYIGYIYRKSKNNLNKLFHNIIELSKVYSAAVFVIYIVIISGVTNIEIESLLIQSFTIYVSIIEFIVLNYLFVNKYLQYKILLVTEIINDFFYQRGLIILLAIIFTLIFKINSNIYYGIIGSFIFYFLTEISSSYTKKIKNKKCNNTIENFSLFLFNILLIYITALIEKILLQLNTISVIEIISNYYNTFIIYMAILFGLFIVNKFNIIEIVWNFIKKLFKKITLL